MPDIPKLAPIADAPLSLVLLADQLRSQHADLLQNWHQVLTARQQPFEIIFVADSDPDPLLSLPELRPVRPDKPGVGAALRCGLKEVRHPLVACALCQPEYRPEDLALLLARIDAVHFVTGYRAGWRVPLPAKVLGLLWRGVSRLVLNLRREPLPGWLGWRGHLGALLARLFFGVGQRDVACPYRLFRREVLARSPLQSNGTFVWVEQLAKVNFANGVFSAEEIPLPIPPAPGTSFAAICHEARHVFSHPDFGPPVLPAI